MKNMWKRSISLLLALLMTVSVLPAQAFAAEPAPEEAVITALADPAVDAVQTMLDALPDAVESDEEAEAVGAALADIGDAMAELTTEQAARLDLTAYETAAAALEDWYSQDYDSEELDEVQPLDFWDGRKTGTELYDALELDVNTKYYWRVGQDPEGTNRTEVTYSDDVSLSVSDGDVIYIATRKWAGYKYKYDRVKVAKVVYCYNIEVATIPADVGGVTYKTTPYTNGQHFTYYPSEKQSIIVQEVEGYTAAGPEAAPTKSGTYTVNYSSNAAAEYTVTVNVNDETLGATSLTAAGAAMELTDGVGKAKEGDTIAISAVPANTADTLVEIQVNGALLTGTSFTLEGDTTVTVTYQQLTAGTTATVPFNGGKTAFDQLDILKADILSRLGVKFDGEDVTAADVTVQYWPWYMNPGFGGLGASSGYCTKDDEIRELGAAAPTDKGRNTYYDFGERGAGNQEKVVITYNGLKVEREITLAESRTVRPVTLTHGGSEADPVSYASTDVLEAQIKANAALAGRDWTDITLSWAAATLPASGAAAQITVNVAGDAADENYLPVTSFWVWVKAPDAKVTVRFENAGTGRGTVEFGGLTADGDLAPGKYSLTVTPTDLVGTDGSAMYVDKVEINGTDVTAEGTYAKGVFTLANVSLEGGKTYAVKVTWGTRTIDAHDGGVALNLYVKNYVDYSARLDGLKGKLVDAVLGEEANDDDYAVYVWQKHTDIVGSRYESVDDLTYPNQVAGTITVKVELPASADGKLIALSKEEISVAVTESRQAPTISLKETTFYMTTLDDLNAQIKAAIEVKSEGVDITNQVSSKLDVTKIETVNYGQEHTVSVKVTADGATWVKSTEATDLKVTIWVKTFTITWDANGGKFWTTGRPGTLTTNVGYGMPPTPPDAPSKQADEQYTYNFAGWDPAIAEETRVTGEATYTAQWTPVLREYTVTFDAGEGSFKAGKSVQVPVQYGSTVTAPAEVPTRNKYSFLGWYASADASEPFDFNNTQIKGDVTLYARWTEQKVVTFSVTVNGTTTTTTKTVTRGQSVAKPADPTWDADHGFAGWYKGETAWNFADPVEESMTLTAKWFDDYNHNGTDDTTEPHYTVTYQVAGREDEVYSNILTGLATPAFAGSTDRDDWHFTGWQPAVATSVTENVTYVAQYVPDINGNQVDDGQERVTIHVTCADGTYSLTGVKQVGDSADYVFDSKQDAPKLTFSAKSTKTGGYVEKITVKGTEQTVAYAADGTASVTVDLTHGATYNIVVTCQERSIPVLEGEHAIIVNGYNTSSITENLKGKIVKAVLGDAANADDYTVSVYFDVKVFGQSVKGYIATDEKWGSLNVFNAAVGIVGIDVGSTMLVKLELPASADGKLPTVAVQDISVIVKESRTAATIEYTGEDTITANTYADFEAAVKAAVKIYDNDNKDITDTLGLKSVTLTPKTTGESFPTTKDGATVYTVTAKTQYEGASWLNAEKTFEVTAKVTCYTITFDAGDGTFDAESGLKQAQETVAHGQTPIGPAQNPVKASTAQYDYAFNGWTPTIVAATQDATYTAAYTPILREYTVTYKLGYKEGEEDIHITVPGQKYGYPTSKPADPAEREGYNFLGWYDAQGKAFDFANTNITGDLTLTAKWTQEFVVSFVDRDTPYGQSQTVAKDDKAVKPADPAWDDDHDFLGWFNGETAYDFDAPVTGNLTLTAKWRTDFNHNDVEDGEEDHFTVTYVAEGKENDVHRDVLTGLATPAFAGTKDEDGNPVRAQYVFVGWQPEVAETVTEDATYTAMWLADTNSNGVADALETLTIQITTSGDGDSVTINGRSFTGTSYVYDSAKDTVLTIKATPVTELNTLVWYSKTYVASIVVNGVEQSLTYNADFSVEVTVPLTGANQDGAAAQDAQADVVITFAPAGFQWKEKEERVLHYYPGMTGVKNQDVYNAAVTAPAWSDSADITVEYLARPAGTNATINLNNLQVGESYQKLYDTLLDALEVIPGYSPEITIPQSETWVTLGEDLTGKDLGEGKSYEEMVNALLQEELAKILDAFNEAYNDSILNLFSAAKAAYDQIVKIGESVADTAKYYGAHEFGDNASTSQDMEETIRLTYAGSERRIRESDVIILRDLRTPTQLIGSDKTLIYKDFKDTDLAELLGLTVQTLDGIAIDDQTIQRKEGSAENAPVSDTAYSITFRFPGNETYKPCEGTFAVTIAKAPASIDVHNVLKTWDGENYTMQIDVTRGNQYGDDQEITDSLIQFIIGLNVADLTLKDQSLTGTKPTLQLILPENLKSGLSGLFGDLFADGVEMSLSDLVKYLEIINSDSLGVLQQAIQAIIDVAGAADVTIKLGGKLPTDIGAYFYGAVSTSGNYETAFDVAYIVITPDAQRVYLDFDYNDTNGIFTPELLDKVDLGASAYDDEAHLTLNSAASDKVSNLFFGVNKDAATGDPKLVLKLFPKDVDPAGFETELGNGLFTQMAFIVDFGNTLHYAVPIVRAFAIVPNTVQVELIDEEGTNFKRTYDGQAQALTARVSYDGTGIDIDPEEYLTVSYYGVQTNGELFRSGAAPTEAGAYVVTAIYFQRNAQGDLVAIGADVKTLLVLPAATTTVVDDAVLTRGESVALSDLIHVTYEGSKAPEMTILTARLATDGSFSENGWDAIEGNVNIDFPAWVDAILAEQYPDAFENGMTAAEFSAKIGGKLSELVAKLELSEELKAALNDMIGQVNGLVSKLPVNATLTFNDTAADVFSQVGVYLVGAMVTDSNYLPSVDCGLVVVQPEVNRTYLDWNWHDANGIWTAELLRHVDLYASAYDDPEFLYKNEADTAKIVHQFLTVNQNGDLVVYTDQKQLGNGAYIELAYIPLVLDGQMTIGSLLARPLVTIPDSAKVEFVDESGKVNHDRKFTYDGAAHGMPVRVTLNGSVITPAEGELTVTYMGVTTAGETYRSTEAPTEAGVYTVTAVFTRYEDNKLTGVGAAVGAMVILPAQVDFSVTGGRVPYDGKPHGVTVVPNDKNYTLISGTANVAGNVTEVGLEAITANLNVDFPAWVDAILAERFPDAYANGIDAAKLIAKLEEHRADLIAQGVSETWLDAMITALNKVPANMDVTFKDNITFTAPGVYVFAGFLTDFNYLPASDTALLIIEKEDAGMSFADTTVTYDGKGHFITVVNPVTDYAAIIIDRENNIGNILLEDDLLALKSLLEKALGKSLPERIDVGELQTALKSILDQLESMENLLEGAAGVLTWIRETLAQLPQTGVVYLNGDWRPTDVGEYEFYGLMLSPRYQSTALSGKLTIVPAKVTITVDDKSKTYGDADPAFTGTVTGVVEGEDLDVTYKRAEGQTGEDVGTYTITASYTEDPNYDITVKNGTLTIGKKKATVTIGDLTIAEGETPDLTKVTVTTEGILTGDDVQVTPEVKNTNIITAKITGTKKDNYEITLKDGKLTIRSGELTPTEPEKIAIPAADSTKFTYTGKSQTYTIAENAAYTVSGNTRIDAGEQTVTVSLKDKEKTQWSDGTTDDKTYTFKIEQAVITIKANDKTATVGESAPVPDYTVTGLVNNETLTKQPTASYATTPDMSKAGTVTINVSGAEASDNYTITYQPGTLTINAKNDDGGNGGGGNGGGGGGGSITSTYPINVKKTVHGTVASSHKRAEAGTTITLTVSADAGYGLKSLSVTDKDGAAIAVTAKGSGKYIFTMPASKVDVAATFGESEWDLDYLGCPKDHTCPIWPFKDAKTTAWYHDGVHFCLENGLMVGYDNGNFGPDDATTRAMITVMLWRLNGSPVVDYAMDFTDVAEGQWYTEAIRWAASKDIAQGYGNGTFGPNDMVTREQMVTILYRYAKMQGDGFTGSWYFRLDYPDVAKLSSWADEAMHWCVMKGVIQGAEINGSVLLAPQNSSTRAQMATMMMRFCAEIVK